jgi:hypothetical protein
MPWATKAMALGLEFFAYGSPCSFEICLSNSLPLCRFCLSRLEKCPNTTIESKVNKEAQNEPFFSLCLSTGGCYNVRLMNTRLYTVPNHCKAIRGY